MLFVIECQVFAYQLSTGKPLLAPKPSDGEHRLRVKLRSATPLFISASGEYVATIDVNRLLVWDHAIDLTRRPPNFAHTRNYTVSTCLWNCARMMLFVPAPYSPACGASGCTKIMV